jgi:hypothetical protein
MTLIDTIRGLVAVAWTFRWCVLTCLLFWAGESEPWPWTLVQIAADIALVALIAAVSRAVRAEVLRRRYGLPVHVVPARLLPGADGSTWGAR